MEFAFKILGEVISLRIVRGPILPQNHTAFSVDSQLNIDYS